MNQYDIERLANNTAQLIKKGRLLKNEVFQTIDLKIKLGHITKNEGELFKLTISKELSCE